MDLRVGVVLGSGHGMDGTTGRLVADLVDRMRAHTPGVAIDVDTVVTTELNLGPDCPACLRCMTEANEPVPTMTAPLRPAW